jgi:energy-coupling factor transporter ATP-binding protein EcfA2
MGIAEQISAALAGRAAQRPFVDDLDRTWKDLTDSFAVATSTAMEIARDSAAVRSADSTHAQMLRDVSRYLDPLGIWQGKASELNKQFRERGDILHVLHERVHRDTVNIGVIGITGAGKSTLLRKLSGLGDEQIPSNRVESSTATPCKIFHEPDAGQAGAVLHLHTWISFRDDFLAPLHRLAKLPEPLNWTIQDFRAFRYWDDSVGVQAGLAIAEKYRRRLRTAQQSLNSYEPLFKGGDLRITLDKLRPYVAYPAPGDPRQDHRPYHAVKSVDIFCRFPALDAIRLGLVDLPGAGEAGLEVHSRFLTELRNNTDFLFIVKRPDKSAATDDDWGQADLSDKASAGVPRRDFVREVINRDKDLPDDYFAAALNRAKDKDRQLGIDLLACDISAPADEVNRAVLAPTLDHLAERLAYMDREAIAYVLKDLTALAGQALTLCEEMVRYIGSWQAKLPDEEGRRRDRFKALRDKVGYRLAQVRDEYDALVEADSANKELEREIEQAAAEAREWLAGGIGYASADDWMTRYE